MLKVATSNQVDGNGMQSSGSNTRSASLGLAPDLNGTLPTSARSATNGFSWRLTTVFVGGCEGPTMRLRGISSSPIIKARETFHCLHKGVTKITGLGIAAEALGVAGGLQLSD